MKIQILGSSCAKCNTLYENTLQALKSLGLDATVEKVQDIRKIAEFGVPFTPALVVNGEVKDYGKVLSVAKIITILTTMLASE